MSLQIASIAQNCKALRLQPSVRSSHRSPKKPPSASTRICTISKPCYRRRWKIGTTQHRVEDEGSAPAQDQDA